MSKRHRSAASGRFVSAEDAAADPERHVAEQVRKASRDFRHERMAPHMLKIHVPPDAAPGVLHLFTAPDHGPHHDHPWPFRSTVIYGGYREEVLHPDGRCEVIHRHPGDTFEIGPSHVHRIIDLPAGECLTFIEVLGPKVQEPGFYEWRDGVMHHRYWHEPEWSRQAG